MFVGSCSRSCDWVISPVSSPHSAVMLSSLRLPGLSEELADDVGLWSALDLEFETLREVGEPSADVAGLQTATVDQPKDPLELGASPGVVKVGHCDQLAPHTATVHSQASSSAVDPNLMPASSLGQGVEEHGWAHDAASQHELVGMHGQRQGKLGDSGVARWLRSRHQPHRLLRRGTSRA